MSFYRRRWQLWLGLLLAVATVALCLRTTTTSAERGSRRDAIGSRRTADQKPQQQPTPRPGAMWDKGTILVAEDYVVQDPDWRWPNPNGTNPAPGTPITITYSFAGLDDLPDGGVTCNEVRSAVQEILAVWASYAPLHFVEVVDLGACPDSSDSSYNAAGTPNIRFGAHSIDGPSGTLAHAYFPYSATDGLAGDVHFDCAESWDTSPGAGMIDFIEVCLHEVGHALGLGHEPSPPGGNNAIMNPIYGERFSGPGSAFLLQDDIDGIRAIYGTGVGSVTPLPSGGCGSCTVTCDSGGCALLQLMAQEAQDDFFDLLPMNDLLLGGRDRKLFFLETIYAFRDTALQQSPEGRQLAALYYEHSAEMTRLFATHPAMAAETLSVLRSAYPYLAAASDEDATALRVDPATLARGLDLVQRYQACASPEFREALAKLQDFVAARRSAKEKMIVLDLSAH